MCSLSYASILIREVITKHLKDVVTLNYFLYNTTVIREISFHLDITKKTLNNI